MRFLYTCIVIMLCLTANPGQGQYLNQLLPYQWINPGIQGHDLLDVKWLPGKKLVACGDQGTIITSQDSGTTWNVTQIPTITNFRFIEIADSNTWITGGGETYGNGQIYRSPDAGQTWDLVFDDINITLHDAHFPTDSIGYAVGNIGKILKTTDGGQTWNFLISGNVSNLRSVWFLNPDTGFAGGENYGLYKTTNGGISWSLVSGYLANNCHSLCFVNDTLGWAGAYGGLIFRTFNGGLSWIQQYNQNNFEAVRKLSFANPSLGIGVSNAYIYRTTNGVNWSSTFYVGMTQKCCALDADGDFMVGGQGGNIRLAQNFGTTFTLPNTGFSLNYCYSADFSDPLNGWISGDGGRLYRSTDGGNSWTFSASQSLNDLYDIHAFTSQKAIAVGANGEVVTTLNGGANLTIQVLGGGTNNLNALAFPTASIGYTAGNGGFCYKTTNGGSSWSALSTGITDDIQDLHFINGQTGYLLSTNGWLKKTVNGGSTWTDIPLSNAFAPFNAMWWIDQDTGMVSDNNYNLVRTTNGGQTWTPVTSLCSGLAYEIEFIDSQNGFAVGSTVNASCDIAYTRDAGRTWSYYNLPYKYPIFGIHAFDTSSVVLTGPNQTIIKTGMGVVTANEENSPGGQKISDLRIFPNPTSGNCSLMLDQVLTEEAFLSLKDLSGRTLRSFAMKKGEQTTEIQTASLPPGIYLLECMGQTKKILVTK